MSRTFALLVASLVAVASATGIASDRWSDQVRLQMIGVALTAVGGGYSLDDDLEVGSLHEGSSTTFSLRVAKSGSVVLVGSCDADCSDVDLVLLGPDGREIAADREADDVPIIEVPVSHRGSLSVRVEMASCSRGPCRFGLGLFSK